MSVASAPTVSSECIVAENVVAWVGGSSHDSVTVTYECSLDKRRHINKTARSTTKQTIGNNKLSRLVERVGVQGGGELPP